MTLNGFMILKSNVKFVWRVSLPRAGKRETGRYPRSEVRSLENFVFEKNKNRLSLQDTDFIENVESDIRGFLGNQTEKRVLVFPPFNSFRRCLIHQLVESQFENLKTFSIGEGEDRRTVVCFNKDYRLDIPSITSSSVVIHSSLNTVPESRNQSVSSTSSVDAKPESQRKVKRARTMPSVSIYRPPAARKLEQNANFAGLPTREMVASSSPEKKKLKCPEEPKDTTPSGKRNESDGVSVFRNAITSIRAQNKVPKCKSIESTNKKNESDGKSSKTDSVAKSNSVQNRQRRPDQQVYVPKGRRVANEPKASVSPVREEKSCKSSEPADKEANSTNCEAVASSAQKEVDIVVENSERDIANKVPQPEVTSCDTQKESLPKSDLNSSQNREHSVNSSSEKVTENKKSSTGGPLNPDECDWESMFDDTGECLDPSLLDQLTSAVGEVTIEKPKSGYNGYKNKSLDMVADEFPHVIEIYNFPPEFQLQDLMTVFSQFKNSGFEIKWVDDTHALGIFSSSAVVSEVLSFYHPFVKTRSLKEGTPLSKMKARRSAEFLLPYKPRPDTCPALARRLVTGALGVRLPTSREEREAEKKILTKAREKKRLEAKQKEDAWEGTFS